MSLLFVAGIGVAVFIEFLLLSKKRKSSSDVILTVWMVLIILHLFLFTLFFTGDHLRVPFLLGIEHPLPLLHGVFLYYYVASVTEQLPKRRTTLLLHLLPALLMYGYLVSFFSLPDEEKIAVYRNKGAGYEVFGAIKLYTIAVSGIVYVVVSSVLLRRHRRNVRDSFSDLAQVELQWLRVLTIGLGGIWLLILLFRSEILIFSGVVTFIFLIGFFGVRQGNIFSHGRLDAAPGPEPDVADEETAMLPLQGDVTAEQPKKYSKSGLGDEAAAALHTALIRLMVEKQRFKQPDLTIDDLAAELDAPPNHLSQVINQMEAKNFYDFVNAYRVAAFKHLIEVGKNRQFTLLSLAFDCGFSSKSSFNRCFKKETGQTPSQFAASFSEGVEEAV
ncbi:MAG: helix-turn-helix transcriptional regulator [Ignavibacteriae bacterium]|nr:helix-turn-helix transcriptional regulator [Ignavibacteriota bacterium]